MLAAVASSIIVALTVVIFVLHFTDRSSLALNLDHSGNPRAPCTHHRQSSP